MRKAIRSATQRLGKGHGKEQAREKNWHIQRLIARCKKEARFRKNLNDLIGKQLVAKAKDTGRGMGMENLKGIGDRTQFRKPQRARISGWSFFQLRSFVEYKATLASVAFEGVDPRDSSRTCAECGYCNKANRKSQSDFECGMCGHKAHADVNSARILGFRASTQSIGVWDRNPGLPVSTGPSP